MGELIAEVEDICKVLDWKYNCFIKKNPFNDNGHIQSTEFIKYKIEDLKGIAFAAGESATSLASGPETFLKLK